MIPYFLCIGAQKSGTTTLHHFLKSSSEIELPFTSKEAPFFSENDRYTQGWEKYFQENFISNTKKKYGKVSPQYMYHESIPYRIKKLFPDIKIIAILRDPIDRAISQYRMNLARGYETRSINKAFEEELIPEKLIKARALLPQRYDKGLETNCYLVRGEYGRLLKPYFANFDKSQILVLFFDDLKERPKYILESISKFLNVSSFNEEINIHFHSTKSSKYDLIFNKLNKIAQKSGFNNLIPQNINDNYRRFRAKLRTEQNEVNISNDNLQKLIDLYSRDYYLMKIIGLYDVTWEWIRK